MLTNIMTRTYRVRLIPSADFGVTVGLILFIIKTAMPLAGLFVSLFAELMDLQDLILWAVIGSVFVFFVTWSLFFFTSQRNQAWD